MYVNHTHSCFNMLVSRDDLPPDDMTWPTMESWPLRWELLLWYIFHSIPFSFCFVLVYFWWTESHLRPQYKIWKYSRRLLLFCRNSSFGLWNHQSLWRNPPLSQTCKQRKIWMFLQVSLNTSFFFFIMFSVPRWAVFISPKEYYSLHFCFFPWGLQLSRPTRLFQTWSPFSRCLHRAAPCCPIRSL